MARPNSKGCKATCTNTALHDYPVLASQDNGKFINISMGQGQEERALTAVQEAAEKGGWVVLQNVHLMQDWLKVRH